MFVSGARPDPYVLKDPFGTQINIQHGQLVGTLRSPTINPAHETLVLLIGAAQSNWGDVAPTQYNPSSTANIDTLSIYDGNLREINGPMNGNPQVAPYGNGNIAAQLADNLVGNARFNRVILVPMSVGSTTIAMWATGLLQDRFAVGMRRLAQNGITPTTTGVTFGCLIGIGETDNSLGTSQASFAASLTTFISNATNAGFSGRFFVCKETWGGGSVSSAVQAAQTGIINGTTIFSGGDLDTLNATYRNTDNLHFNDSGLTQVGILTYNALVASGVPY